MQIIPAIKGKTLVEFAKQYHHQSIVCSVKDHPDHLKWLHTMISNAKAFIGGTFHGLDSKYLQLYLHEFRFRTNCRHLKGEICNHLLSACVSTKTIMYKNLVVFCKAK